MTREKVIIIGNGVSGTTVARHIRKLSDHSVTIISDETPYFFSRTALMYVYTGELKFEHTQPYEDRFWDENEIELRQDRVTSIQPEQRTITLDNGQHLAYDKLVIATGAKPRWPDWPGTELKGVQGFYHKHDLDTLEQNAPNKDLCKRAVIVGGGLVGIELVEMLTSRGIHVTFVVREPLYRSNVTPRGESQLMTDHIRDLGIDLRLGANLQEIKGDGSGAVSSVVIKETQEEVPCDLVGLAIGVTPNIDVVKGTAVETRGGILVNEYLETNIPHIYAIGNCAESRVEQEKRNFAANWHTARMMGETLALTICGKKTKYAPSHPFDAAKFLGLEFQSFGVVNAVPEPGHKQFQWLDADNEKCLTIEYKEGTRHFTGVNIYGIRMRHELIDRWLTEGRTIDYFIDHLKEINFDPEFSRRYEKVIQHNYRSMPAVQDQ